MDPEVRKGRVAALALRRLPADGFALASQTVGAMRTALRLDS